MWKIVLLSVLTLTLSSNGETRFNGMKYFGAPGDWISVRLEGFSTEELPALVENDGVRKVIVRHEVPNIAGVHGPNGFPFPNWGDVTVTLRTWEGRALRTLGTQKTHFWQIGQERSFPLSFKGLKSGAYVITAEMPPHVRAEGVYNPTNTGSGAIGLPMLYGRNAMRFALYPKTDPRRVFGVGNRMIHTGEWWTGYQLGNTLEARDLKPVCVSDGDSFQNAILGAYRVEHTIIDAAGPTNVPGLNNAAARMLDIFSPTGRAELVRRGEETGRRLAKDAGVLALALGGEKPAFNAGRVCPTVSADADFRAFCRVRHKDDLAAANRVWKRSFESWAAVRQPIYGVVSEVGAKSGAEAIDWYANTGRIGSELVQFLNRPENVEFAMDWYRWRTKASVAMYADYADAARRYDRKTLYTNNYCWPNFFAHLCLPTWRRLDAAALDFQYVCTFPRTLGSNSEMIEIAEMTESAMRDKPVLGFEIYVQPHYPAEMAALQNWAMVAHGMRVNLVFGWKPYSDHGNKVFKNGPKAWTRPADAKPMWMIIDTDGTRLPCYETVRRSSREIAAWHARFDALSIRRTRARTAIYLSDETGMYTMLRTGDRPYLENHLCHARDRIASGLRLGGVRIEYLDDETLEELDRAHFDTVILPPSPRIASASARRLKDFVRKGGTLIRLEDWEEDFFERHPSVPRSAYWHTADGRQHDVEVVVRTQEKTGRRFVFVLNRTAEPTSGEIAGCDFKPDQIFSDTLHPGRTGRAFALDGWGYRVLSADR